MITSAAIAFRRCHAGVRGVPQPDVEQAAVRAGESASKVPSASVIARFMLVPFRYLESKQVPREAPSAVG
jgi:hypothetical protein